MPYNIKWEIYLYDLRTNQKKLLTESEEGRCLNPIFKPNDSENKLTFMCMVYYGLESDQLSMIVYTLSSELLEKEYNKIMPIIYLFGIFKMKSNLY